MPTRHAIRIRTAHDDGYIVDAHDPDAPHRARCPHCGALMQLYTYPDAPAIYVHADASADNPAGFCPLDARCLHRER